MRLEGRNNFLRNRQKSFLFTTYICTGLKVQVICTYLFIYTEIHPFHLPNRIDRFKFFFTHENYFDLAMIFMHKIDYFQHNWMPKRVEYGSKEFLLLRF